MLVSSGSAIAQAKQCRSLNPGVVIVMEGGSQAFELMRKGQRTKVGYYTELQEGDRIRMVAAGLLRIQQANGQFVSIQEMGSWFCIVAGPRLTWWNNATRSIGELLTVEQDGVDDLLTRNDESFQIAPRDVAAGTARIGTGKRYLALSWFGGEAPFNVTISKPGQSALVAETNINARLLRLTSAVRDVAPGTYTVEVRDADGRTVTGSFTASGSVDLPDGSDEALARAGALLAAEPAQLYEAFLLLSPYRRDSKAASDLMNIISKVK
jgi:hypothetical protein